MDLGGIHIRWGSAIVSITGGVYLLSLSMSGLDMLLQMKGAFIGDGTQLVKCNCSLFHQSSFTCVNLSCLRKLFQYFWVYLPEALLQ